MFALLKPDVFWLIVANLLLGLITLSCFAFLAVSVIKDLRLRSRQKREVARIPEDHLSGLKDLGITILSEGQEIDEMEHQM
ncbi:MAG: hypothetical protein NTZ35_18520 [Ignavibacteriales bacterium]|nr:hypothetical protein [Ignavibacteriales bacterium]